MTLGFQVHHIFPEAMMEDFAGTFKKIGINIDANDYSNRINLFNNNIMAGVKKYSAEYSPYTLF